MKGNRAQINPSRRRFVKHAAYVAPAILTLTAMPAFASAGSGRRADSPDQGGPLSWWLRLLRSLGWF